MHQRQFNPRAARDGSFNDACGPGNDTAAGRRRHEDDVGLTATLPGPAGCSPIRDIHHIVVDLFDAVEPGCRVRGGACIPDQFGAAGFAQLVDQTRGQIRDV